VLLALGLSVTVLYVDAAALVPALQSGWLVVHVLAAMIATGAFALGALLSALFLVKDRSDRRLVAAVEAGQEPVEGAISRLLPDAAAMDRLAYRINAFTFPLWTFAVIAGAIWAENAWGRYWGWDPKETWAFITWVVYAAYLHARATAGWKARGSSWIAIAGFGCLMFNYFGVNLFITGLHSYSGV
jgi:cytochrome c-type biogenesis protein CcsB